MKVKNLPIPVKGPPINLSLLSKLKRGEAEFYENVNYQLMQSCLVAIRNYSGIKFAGRKAEHYGKKGMMVWRLS